MAAGAAVTLAVTIALNAEPPLSAGHARLSDAPVPIAVTSPDTRAPAVEEPPAKRPPAKARPRTPAAVSLTAPKEVERAPSPPQPLLGSPY